MTYKLTKEWPQHIESGAFVNPDTNTTYLAWLAEGNTSDPADPPTPEQIAAQAAQEALLAARAEAKADNIVQYLRDHTPAECAQYVEDNVTNLASAKAFLKKVAIVLCALSKESLR